jgi:hypothetical protein
MEKGQSSQEDILVGQGKRFDHCRHYMGKSPMTQFRALRRSSRSGCILNPSGISRFYIQIFCQRPTCLELVYSR